MRGYWRIDLHPLSHDCFRPLLKASDWAARILAAFLGRASLFEISGATTSLRSTAGGCHLPSLHMWFDLSSDSIETLRRL